MCDNSLEEQLWQVQTSIWPTSRKVSFDEVFMNWPLTIHGTRDAHVIEMIAMTKGYKEGFFYELHTYEESGAVWRGYRYGLEPHEYLSGFNTR